MNKEQFLIKVANIYESLFKELIKKYPYIFSYKEDIFLDEEIEELPIDEVLIPNFRQDEEIVIHYFKNNQSKLQLKRK